METQKFPALNKKDENGKSNENTALHSMVLFMLNRRFEIKQIKIACHLEKTEKQ